MQHPDRAHLYLKIGGLRRDPLADQTPMLLQLAQDHATPTSSSAALTVPTLFIVGTEDEIFPPAIDRGGRGAGPGSRVEMIEGAGHSPYFEQPDAWNALVQGFWFPAQ